MRNAYLLRVLKSPSGAIGALLLLMVLLMALSAHYFYPNGPWTMAARPYQWPMTNPGQPLGTDTLGRNILTSLLYGARISLWVGVASTLAACVVGIAFGTLAGFYGKAVDSVLMRITDAFQTVPSFLFAIVIVAVLTPSIGTIIFAIALVSWPMVARLMRAEVMRVKSAEFVQACRVLGMSDCRILLTQILPNSLSPIVVASSVLVSSAITTEAGLAFLGLGDPNVMSWGTIVNLGRASIRTNWYIAIIPGICILLTVLALNMLGDAINDAGNPRLIRRR
ncbi:ABC transporter permease [Brenneria sp. g21c3]|uniref:ABC transporter permease n=1 Tax=Brenneria sp. g21c3 TaxID=3093893 RepID=UPI002EBBED07|nr:ABC transporter permease [Brenneria sp. g21c3]